jgi:hypothetical protein
MVHHITAATSVFAPTGDAFANSGPDTTLIVDADAFLISATGGDGARLDGAWTATINGEVDSFDSAGAGVRLTGSTPADAFKVTIGNTGDVFGAFGLRFEQGTGTVTNKGSIAAAGFGTNGTGSVGLRIAADGDVTINNSGSIQSTGTGLRHFGTGVLTLVNSGTIAGAGVAISSSGEAHIKNLGTLDGDVGLGDTDDTFSNFGFVKKLTSHGFVKIIKNGTVDGLIDLGDGVDLFNGGTGAETVRDSAGNDTYNFGGGNDTFIAFDGSTSNNDIVNGGKGIDTYVVTGGDGQTVNLKDHITIGGNIGSDTITGFENVIGGDGSDELIGSNGANSLTGGIGDDDITGLGGRDILTGGVDTDTFIFLALSDSGPKASQRDLITDFTQGEDLIDIVFDAKTGIAGIQAFTLIGVENFHGVKGELRESFKNGNTIVSGDVNGDGNADFSVALKGHFLLTTDDFTNVL